MGYMGLQGSPKGVVNELIAAAKAVFLKAPSQVCTFKEQLPEVPLPPESRWGLRAVEYYHRHFVGIKDVVSGWSANKSMAGRKAENALGKQALEGSPLHIFG